MIRIMNGVANISRNVAQAWLTGVWLFLIVYFAAFAFQGNSSVFVRDALIAQQAVLEAEAEQVAANRQILENKVKNMGGKTIDPDLLEELVRSKLGFAHPDEIVVFLN